MWLSACSREKKSLIRQKIAAIPDICALNYSMNATAPQHSSAGKTTVVSDYLLAADASEEGTLETYLHPNRPHILTFANDTSRIANQF